MAKLLKLRRGTTTQHGSFTGAEGEVTVDTDKETLVVHDGSTAGGHPVAAEDMANVSSANIAGRLSNDSIATSKLAAGALPSDVTVASANLVNGTIATADIGADQITNALIADDQIDSEHYVDGSIDHAHLSNDCIDGDNIQNDVINSEHYVAGSIDHEHLANDIIDGDNIQDDVINSEHYVAGSIDHEHLANDAVDGDNIADNSINSEHYVDGSIDTAHIANNAVTADKLPNSAVTFAKITDIPQNRIAGRISSGSGAMQELTAANVRTIINEEDGATADQSASEILTLIKTVDGAGSGLDADYLDGFTSAHYMNASNLNAGTVASGRLSASGIATLLNGQNLYTTGALGRDGNDNMQFVDNSHLNININGNNEFRFEADGDFHADGDVIAYSTTISSDENLKKDIVTVPDSLAKVEALKGVTFTWKKNDNKSAGIIAQDVQKVLPDAVRTVADFDGNDYLTVNYNALISILIEAIKELSTKVKALEAK